jgi:beta-aspartyl-peptidase (threonine type)
MHVFVHGGAGSAPDQPEPRQGVLDEAASAGADRGTPQAAVVAAARHLETSPRFNAGTGSAVQSDGQIRTDAGLMTDDGESGAACSMPGVEHAIDVARVVKGETPHVMVAGERAVALADAFGVDTDSDLWSDRSRETWTEATEEAEPGESVRGQIDWIRDRFGMEGPVEDHDTVGAVATDGDSLAAATSTGGRWFALAGRVGDVPQIGAGFYASEAAAASATGEGEAIARFGLSRQVVAAVADGDDPQTAADRVIRGFEAETGGQAGVIVLDRSGSVGRAANTEAMQTSAAGSDEQ